MTFQQLFLATVAICLPESAFAQWGPENVTYSPAPGPDAILQINLQHSIQLKAFRTEALAVQKANGGTLTLAHRAELQAKLDQIESAYRRRLHRYDAWSVDSFGHRQ